MTYVVGLLLVQQGKVLLVRQSADARELTLPAMELEEGDVDDVDPEILARRLSLDVFGVASAFVARVPVACHRHHLVVVAEFDSDRPVHVPNGAELVSAWPHELAHLPVCPCILELPSVV